MFSIARSVASASPEEQERSPGMMTVKEGELESNSGRETMEIRVTNMGDRPVQVGSHYHFIETNAQLQFDRGLAYGGRLDIPAGTAVRFEPGETRTVRLVRIAGHQIIRGGNNLVDGAVGAEAVATIVERATSRGFLHKPQ